MEELNDDDDINPKIRVDELVRIADHGPVLFRVMKIVGTTLELEKL